MSIDKQKLNKLKKILEINKNPSKVILELSETKVDKEEFNRHAEQNEYEHRELYNKIESVELIKGKKGDTGDEGIRGSKFLGKFETVDDLLELDDINVIKGDWAFVVDTGEIWYT